MISYKLTDDWLTTRHIVRSIVSRTISIWHQNCHLPTVQRTGTKPCMSHDLNITWQMGHMYQHDLKSLFYVVLIFCCHYGKHVLSPGLRKLPGTRPFDQCFSGSCHIVHALQNAWIT
ncbi:hypothetical protein K435DRAFT_102725 [Dendrothele bispora CBS 962.96]|uniref:Fungal-type protein kinase domain-containing protein n=1 Tax=Dendrothele bispora (strain CBS 962.96) TaxID=1314807 RepID=A0A4S8M225_DENBC|nr:hypothetical protein K435DRAFT_102725 [Dendrothele bispora CBS 962.96]